MTSTEIPTVTSPTEPATDSVPGQPQVAAPVDGADAARGAEPGGPRRGTRRTGLTTGWADDGLG